MIYTNDKSNVLSTCGTTPSHSVQEMELLSVFFTNKAAFIHIYIFTNRVFVISVKSTMTMFYYSHSNEIYHHFSVPTIFISLHVKKEKVLDLILKIADCN